jgi:Uma2 family endonuclease
MAQARLQTMTAEQFLAWEQQQEQRHEFVDGVAVAMAGGTRAHDRIQRNLITGSTPRLRGSRCEPLGPDMLVITGTGNGRYPDMTIDCGQYEATALAAAEPRIVFEILSESTKKTDQLAKLVDYDATPSIRHYVLVSQIEPLVLVYTRGAHGSFSIRPATLRGLEAALELPAVGMVLPMAEIYDGLDFPAPPEPASGRVPEAS